MTDANKPKKTLMNEILPTPVAHLTPAGSSSSSSRAARSPRERVQRRFEELAKRAALAGAAGTLSACIGYGVVDPLPPPAQQCAPADDVNSWASVSTSANGDGSFTLFLVINQFERTDVTLSTHFTAEGATLAAAQFDATDLAHARSVSIIVTPDAAASEVIVHTGLSCAGAGRPVDVHIDVGSLSVTIADAP